MTAAFRPIIDDDAAAAAAAGGGFEPPPPTPLPPPGQPAGQRYQNVAQALGGAVAEPLDIALGDLEQLFVEFWQRFVVFSIVLLAFLLLAVVVPKVVAAIGRKCGCYPWNVTQLRYSIRIGLVTLGVVAAFGSVGVSYDVLFLGIVISGATMSMSGVVNNAFCGVFLQSGGTVHPGAILTVRGRRGIVMDTDLNHVRLLLIEHVPGAGIDEDGDAATPAKEVWRRTNRHFYVPNNVLCTEPFEANKFARGSLAAKPVADAQPCSQPRQQQQQQPPAPMLSGIPYELHEHDGGNNDYDDDDDGGHGEAAFAPWLGQVEQRRRPVHQRSGPFSQF